MTFSDTSSLGGIIQTYERLTDQGQTYVSGNATLLADVTATINRINHRVWHTIFSATGNWQYDDGNYTTLPISATNLVSGTSAYALPSDALTVQKIEVKDINGLWVELSPMTKEQIKVEGIDEFLKTDGPVQFYRLVNGTIELFPAPNYASTGGLKVYFDRDSVDFAVSDTTKIPGFASPYHEIIPIMAAIEWYKVKQPNSATMVQLQQDQLRLERAIKDFYGLRFKSLKPRIKREYQSFK